MALKDSVLNIVIRAKDKAAGTFGKIRNSLKRTDKETNTLAASMKKLGVTITGLAGAYLGINALKNAFLGILGTGADFEKFRAQLDQVMGSVEGGAQATQWIKEFTRRTPFELAQVTEGFVKLKAFGIDPMNGTYEALANQAAALGGDQETLNGIILATGQAWAKQKLQGEEILQLVERGVPVWDLLAKSTGKSVTELQKLSSAGKLGRKEISGLIQEIGKASDGALKGQMSTLNGLVSNVRDQWTQFTATIADSGLQDYVKGVLSDLINKFNELRNNGKLKEWAKQISDAFIGLAETVKNFAANAVGDIDTFGKRASSTLQGINTTLKVTGAGISLFVTGIKAAFNGAVVTASATYGKMAELASKFTGAIGLDSLSQSLKHFASTASDTYDQYSARLRENNATIKTAASDLSDALISEAKRGAEGAAKEQAKGAKLTGDALKAAVDEADAQTKRLSGQLDKINADVSSAIAETRKAWADVYSTTGQAKADALVQLNSAIKKENELRRSASDKAIEYNKAVADSEKLVGKLAAEKATAQAVAAGKAREALQGLGIDAGAAFDKISTAAQDSINNLTAVADNIQKIAPASDKAAAAFEQGISAALKNISTAEEFKAIEAQVRGLFSSDKIDSTALSGALDLIREKQKAINDQAMGDSIDAAGKKADEAKVKVADLANETKKAADAAAEAKKGFLSAFGDAFSKALSTARESVTALSTAARNLFETKIGGNAFVSESVSASEALAQTRQRVDELARSRKLLMNTSFAAWFTDTALAAAEVKQQFYEQAVAMENLQGKIESGTFSMDQLNQVSTSAANKFNLLDSQRLAGLQTAIDAAKSKLESLNSSAESTLNSLQQRLANLQGNADEAARLQYEAERQRLQKQLEQARQAGADSAAADYSQAIKQLETIRNIERQKAQEAEQERQRQAEARKQQQAQAASQEAQSRQQASTTTSRQDSTQSTGRQTIVLQTPTGGQTEVQTNDPEGLLSLLEQTGLRSAP